MLEAGEQSESWRDGHSLCARAMGKRSKKYCTGRRDGLQMMQEKLWEITDHSSRESTDSCHGELSAHMHISKM